MRCDDVDRWLDDGRPESGGAEARAHAVECARCTARLDAARAMDVMLATPAPAPAGFADRVMARIARAPVQAPARSPDRPEVESALPWWIEVTAEPVAAMALVIAALLVSQAPAWLAVAPARVAQVGLWITTGIAAFGLNGRVSLSPFQTEALWVALLPPAILLGFPLYRFAQRLVGGRVEALSTAP